MYRNLFLVSLLFFSLNSTAANANENNFSSPIVVELFTSQSCSSCPPADKILGDLAKKNDNIIALSCNVTYWNHLHWEDTLSQDFCTERQRGYVISLDSRGPYTPQTVINGQYEMVGSREANIKKAIANINTPLIHIPISKNSNNLNINLPRMDKGQYVVTLIAHGDAHTQDIPGGENRGKTVNYTNPVTKILPLNTWDGTKGTMELANVEIEGDKNIVIVVHEGGARGAIVAAGKLAL